MRSKSGFLPFFIFHFSFFILLSGCGYKPSSHYAKNVMGEKVSTQVLISLEDPENTVLIKDAIDSAVIMRFRSSLTDRASAVTHLQIMLQSVSLDEPLQYNEKGLVTSYRTKVTLQILRTTDGFAKTYHVTGVYDFAIEPNAIISDQARFEAIRYSAEKAMDSFIAQVAAEGTHKGE